MFDDDALEIAELSAPAPPSPDPGPRAGWFFAALGLAVSLLVGFVIVTVPAPGRPTDLVGLGAAPTAAWSVRLRSDETVYAVGPSLVVIRSYEVVEGRTAIRALAAHTGAELWRLDVDGGDGQFEVRDLPGTAWVSVRTGTVVRLVDRMAGKESFRLHLPSRHAWLGSSDRGMLLLAVPDGDRLRISRLRGPELDDPVWTTEVDLARGMTMTRRDTELLERDGMLLVRIRDGWRGSQRYSLILDAWTGRQPDWAHDQDRFVISRGVAVGDTDDGLVAHDLASGRRLWKLDPAPQVLGTEEVLLAESAGQLRRLDPYSGRTQWIARTGRVFTDLIVRADRLILYAGAQTIYPEVGTTSADSPQPWIAALDLTTGRQLWHRWTGTPVLDVLVAPDLLIARMYDPALEEPSFEVAGVDPAGGTVAWRWRLRQDVWALTKLGPRVATFDPDGTLTVWG